MRNYYTKESFLAIDCRYSKLKRLMIRLADYLLPPELCIITTDHLADLDKVGDYKQQASLATSEYYRLENELNQLKHGRLYREGEGFEPKVMLGIVPKESTTTKEMLGVLGYKVEE